MLPTPNDSSALMNGQLQQFQFGKEKDALTKQKTTTTPQQQWEIDALVVKSAGIPGVSCLRGMEGFPKKRGIIYISLCCNRLHYYTITYLRCDKK